MSEPLCHPQGGPPPCSYVEPKVDLKLSKLRLDSAPESSHTEESLLLGYYENVVFTEWEDFDDIMKEAFDEVENLDTGPVQEAVSRMWSANNQVNEDFFPMMDKDIGSGIATHGTIAVAKSREDTSVSRNEKLEGNTINASAFTSVLKMKTDRRKKFNSCTSVEDIHSDVFKALRAMIRGIHRNSFCLDIAVKSFPVAGSAHMGLRRNPLADRSLVRYEKNGSLVVPPVCAFELKGPKLDIWSPAIDFNVTMKMSSTRSNKMSKKSSTSDASSIGKRMRQSSRSANKLEEREARLAAKEEILKFEALINGSHCPSGHEVSAESMCVLFNYLFGDVKHFYLKGGKVRYANVTKQIMNCIAQTLTQALTTSSLCSFLYTHEFGIAFEIAKKDENENRLVIRTSRLFSCEHQKGTTAAMLAMAHYSVKKTIENGGEKLNASEFANKIRSEVRRRSQNTRGTKDITETAPSSNGTPNVAGLKEFDGSGNGPGELLMSLSGTIVEKSDESKTFVDQQTVELDFSKSTSTDTSCVTSEENRCEKVLEHLFATPRKVLAIGGSGMILDATWEGKRVVVKVWNGKDESGLKAFSREVNVYHFMEAHNPKLLGSVVPRLFIACDSMDSAYGTGIALVTEYVGKGLKRDSDGSLLFGDGERFEGVGVCTELAIFGASLQTLKGLHKSGVIHGDVNLRNIRVEQISKGTWLVWWIDFGQSEVNPSPEGEVHSISSANELENCISLFPDYVQSVEDINL